MLFTVEEFDVLVSEALAALPPGEGFEKRSLSEWLRLLAARVREGGGE